jgi:hypothetical protein
MNKSLRSRKILTALFAIIGIIISLIACQQKPKSSAPIAERGSLPWDYSGKFAQTINSDSLSTQDSLQLIQYLYQTAAIDLRLYELQAKLTKAYFWGCHENCIKRRCTSGDIAAAAVAYLIDGQVDSAVSVIGQVDREINGNALEIDDITLVINMLAENKFENDWLRPYKDGVIKTPTGIAIWAIATIDKGASPKEWMGSLTKSLKTSDSPALKYAFAYALVKTGQPLIAWQMLPVYVPRSGQSAPADFIQTLPNGDTSNVSRINLTTGLYVRCETERSLLSKMISEYPESYTENLYKLTILAHLKEIENSNTAYLRQFELAKSRSDQLSLALGLIDEKGKDLQKQLARLTDPLARATYLLAVANDKQTESGKVKNLIFSEIEKINTIPDNEPRILLTIALNKKLTPPEVLSRTGALFPSETLFTNDSPEWLALYAINCVNESTNSRRLEMIGAKFADNYPYAAGTNILITKLNRLCGY